MKVQIAIMAGRPDPIFDLTTDEAEIVSPLLKNHTEDLKYPSCNQFMVYSDKTYYVKKNSVLENVLQDFASSHIPYFKK